ncbi:MAG TPA: hypothetical protein VK483_07435 [Chitinophagaceae bacterium]|nr:hypothetical protein [Chitinophagaceae bacterium]
MKRLLYPAQIILFGFLIVSLLATCLQVFGDSNPLSKLDYKVPVYNNVEEYDPSLARLNSIDKLVKYCDSLYLVTVSTNNEDEIKKDYTDIVSSVVRKRFYHGYSYYGVSRNYMSLLLSKLTIPGLDAVVIPDEILKYSFAACSQQSIVVMEVLQSKGFETRKVSFQGKTSGHFCFEVYFEGGWHFYDTNMEPDPNVLQAYGRPGITFLVNHPDILLKAYGQYPKNEVMDIFPTYTFGEINKFPAPKALIFQKLTKILSYFIWFFFLFIFLIVRLRYLRVSGNTNVQSRRTYFPRPEAGRSPSYYPGIVAPGA